VSELYPYPPLALQVADLDAARAARLAG